MSVLTQEAYQTTETSALDEVTEKIKNVICDTVELDPLAVKMIAGMELIPQNKVNELFLQMTQNLTILGFDIKAKQGTLEKDLDKSEDARAMLELYEELGVVLISETPEILSNHAGKVAKAIEIVGTTLAETVTEADITSAMSTPSTIAIVETAHNYCEDPDHNKNAYRVYEKLYVKKQNEAQNETDLKLSALPKLNPYYKKLEIYGPGTAHIQSKARYAVKPHEKSDLSFNTSDIESLRLLLANDSEKTTSEPHTHSFTSSAIRGLKKFLRSRN